MARLPRLYVPSCAHHIIQRGNIVRWSIGRINTPLIFPIYNKKRAIGNRQVIINPLAVQLLSAESCALSFFAFCQSRHATYPTSFILEQHLSSS
ncbi:MAG: hypothetical protein ACJAUP_003014 [Cellvibrionaceae bacterium]|jgi:hypothetical protein